MKTPTSSKSVAHQNGNSSSEKGNNFELGPKEEQPEVNRGKPKKSNVGMDRSSAKSTSRRSAERIDPAGRTRDFSQTQTDLKAQPPDQALQQAAQTVLAACNPDDISVAEGVCLVLAEKALAGNLRAARQLFNYSEGRPGRAKATGSGRDTLSDLLEEMKRNSKPIRPV